MVVMRLETVSFSQQTVNSAVQKNNSKPNIVQTNPIVTVEPDVFPLALLNGLLSCRRLVLR